MVFECAWDDDRPDVEYYVTCRFDRVYLVVSDIDEDDLHDFCEHGHMLGDHNTGSCLDMSWVN